MRILLLLILIILSTGLVNAQSENAGFVQGLWYSSEKIFVDQPVRIYVAIRNNTGSDMTGTIEFFAGNKLLERNTVSGLNGRVIESWADWTPTYGEHQLKATLSRVELHQVGSTTKKIQVTAAEAEDLIFVDYDTDGDQIGNESDNDDDGDGIVDSQDDQPLIFNEPEEEISENDIAEETASSNQKNDDEDSKKNDNQESEGLEQFLVDSPADTALSSVTSVINNTKSRLDTYRDERNQNKTTNENEESINDLTLDLNTTGSSSPTTTNNDESRIGDITRTQNAGGPGIVSGIIKAIGAVLERGYTLILFIFSSYLAHPAIVQLTLLFLILFIIFKLAKRLANRPQ